MQKRNLILVLTLIVVTIAVIVIVEREEQKNALKKIWNALRKNKKGREIEIFDED
ncbi:hypothetical protein LJC10_02520 [Selenomonadales bacterium OttesenSCG-928-I06]|nr:hypothetical protein [Selenomonadales bacterium OttesenSCG-928-I06]